MDKFESKVRLVLSNLEEQGIIASKPAKENEEFFDPMTFDTEEVLSEKKTKWMDIFQRCPDFADHVLAIYNDMGENGIKEFDKFILDAINLSYTDEGSNFCKDKE